MALPEVVSPEQWQIARDALLVKEKELTKAADAVNAERRRLPMVEVTKQYTFESPDGPVDLLGLFEGRRQLIVYHFMLFADDPHRCPGCSLVLDNMGHPAHLHARDTTLVVTAPARLSEIQELKQRMGWSVPWVSAHGNGFTEDMGAGAFFGVSVFLREGDDVYRTYFTTGRGGDQLVGSLRYLDLTPLGRQEKWEEPAGRGSDEPSGWWRLHDSY